MPTGLKVVLSKKADKDFDDIIHYIKEAFGTQHAINFKELILSFLDLLKAFPEIGSLELSNSTLRAFCST